MFDSGGSGQAEVWGVLLGVPESDWTEVLRERHAAIARAQFREVDAVASVYLARCAEDARRGCNEAFQGEFAHVEVGVMLTVTEPVARRWISLGLDLRWRLHRTSTAFSTGRIDQARAQAISDALANVSPGKVETIEQLLLDGIDGATTSMIRRTARRLVARHDPAGARARREQGDADRDIRFRANDAGTCTVEGSLPGPAGQTVAMRLRAMCFEVCAGDPRTFAQRRADALVALADGTGQLRCQCGRDHCPRRAHVEGTAPGDGETQAASDSSRPRVDAAVGAATVDAATDRRETRAVLPTATIHVGVNATTLLGLDDLPGYLAGHGWIDADLARNIAADGTWRRVLTFTDTDRDALLDALCGHTDRDATATDRAGLRPDTEWLTLRRTHARAPGTILGVGRALTAAGITPAAIRARSTRRREQLTYRPSQRLAEIVRARDGHCRFPGCTVRAASCDIDHTVPFDHTQPEKGGRTVEQNLACLCRRHHRLKTIGRWKVRQLGGGRLEWTTPTGQLVTTEPAGEFSAAPSAILTDPATLRRLFGQPRGRGVEDDLKYILDATPPPIAVIDPTRTIPVHDLDRPIPADAEPPPF